MGEEEEQRIVWKLKVGVRVRSFSLKLFLLHNQRLSSWKLHRLSFLLRFRKHLLKIDSHSKPDPIHKPNSRFRFRFGFLRSLAFLRRRKQRQVELQGDSKNKSVWNWNRSSISCALYSYRGGVGVAILIIIILIILNFHLRSS
ncbi:unnamed protein product [Microthlaspi erraticum]|uniref:Transmembrane protein n=1 Tax=Microthlaspi erraticum TaxID=1685480 RepID=A0A6D2J7W3_9BRAS|nr:unnamed protein product [Microthlaspi erraticum]